VGKSWKRCARIGSGDGDTLNPSRNLIAYVAGPYRGATDAERDANIDRAGELAKVLWALGYMAFCPHTNTAGFDGIVPDAAFLEGDLVMLQRCDLIVMTPDWEKSTGAIGEYHAARKQGLPVFVAGTSRNGDTVLTSIPGYELLMCPDCGGRWAIVNGHRKCLVCEGER